MTRHLFARLLETGRKLLRACRRKTRPAVPAGLRLEALEDRRLLSASVARTDVLEYAVRLEIDDVFQQQTVVRQQNMSPLVEAFGLQTSNVGHSIPLPAPTVAERLPTNEPVPDVLTHVAYWTSQQRTTGEESLEPTVDHQWSPFLAPVAVAVGMALAPQRTPRDAEEDHDPSLLPFLCVPPRPLR